MAVAFVVIFQSVFFLLLYDIHFLAEGNPSLIAYTTIYEHFDLFVDNHGSWCVIITNANGSAITIILSIFSDFCILNHRMNWPHSDWLVPLETFLFVSIRWSFRCVSCTFLSRLLFNWLQNFQCTPTISLNNQIIRNDAYSFTVHLCMCTRCASEQKKNLIE